jgi:hypothetical protein
MRKLFVIFTACLCVTGVASAQQKPRTKRPVAKTTVAAKPAAKTEETGDIRGRAFISDQFRFSITLPDTWYIADDNFENTTRKEGFDLSLKPPPTLRPIAKTRLDHSLKRVKVLFTAYRSSAGAKDGAIMRVSAEDLSAVPQVKDAVDYFDLMRKTFQSMKLPADFRYSETQAERLGKKQFAFLDISSKAGKKRMYATVRDGHAIMFTLSYLRDEDLQTMRQILADGDFGLK